MNVKRINARMLMLLMLAFVKMSSDQGPIRKRSPASFAFRGRYVSTEGNYPSERQDLLMRAQMPEFRQ